MCPLPIIAWRRQRLIVPSNTLPRHLPQLPTHPLPKPPHPSQIPRIHPLNPPPKQHRIKNTSRQKRPRKVRMAPVLIMQPNPRPLPQPPLPCHPHGHDDRAKRLVQCSNRQCRSTPLDVPTRAVAPTSDTAPSVRHLLPDVLVEERDVLVHPIPGFFSGSVLCSCRTTKSHFFATTLWRPGRSQSCPCVLRRSAVGDDPSGLYDPGWLAGSRQAGEHARHVVAVGKAVADEQTSGGRHCSDSNQTRPQIRK